MEKSPLTTLCYIEKDQKYLMLHRVKKQKDVNKDKWIGIGGHFELGESPEECLLREVKEETGLTLTKYSFRGIVTFFAEGWQTEYMCLFTSDSFVGSLSDCEEGELEWVEKSRLLDLNLWEGDKIFFRLLMENAPFFSLKLGYDGDRLTEAVLDGSPMELLDIRREDGSFTGRVQERSIVHASGSLHGTAHVWIVRPSDGAFAYPFRNATPHTAKQQAFEILLQKRSQAKDSYPGCYDISSACRERVFGVRAAGTGRRVGHKGRSSGFAGGIPPCGLRGKHILWQALQECGSQRRLSLYPPCGGGTFNPPGRRGRVRLLDGL